MFSVTSVISESFGSGDDDASPLEGIVSSIALSLSFSSLQFAF